MTNRPVEMIWIGRRIKTKEETMNKIGIRENTQGVGPLLRQVPLVQGPTVLTTNPKGKDRRTTERREMICIGGRNKAEEETVNKRKKRK